MALVIRNLAANAGDVKDVGSIPGEDPLEKEIATHCSTLAYRIPWTEEPGRLQSMVSQELDTVTWHLNQPLSIDSTGC